MIVVTWNIQWGRGVDGRVDLQRIVETARALGDFDVLCLQEVADNYPALDGAGRDNQFAQLARLLPGFHAHKGIAVDRYDAALGRQRFGNMILSRWPASQVLRHQLPWPADPENPSMPRIAIEAVIATPQGAVRVVTTHLEYYSPAQRAVQIEALRALQVEASGHARGAQPAGQAGKPFEARPRDSRAILTGDFNSDTSDPLIARLQEPLPDAPAWTDAWPIAHPGAAHPKTVGVHDAKQWKGRRHCFDFFFVSGDLAPRVRRLEIDAGTQASDHQPLLLDIDLTR